MADTLLVIVICFAELVCLMNTYATRKTIGAIVALSMTAIFVSGIFTTGQIGKAFSQAMPNNSGSMNSNMSGGNMTQMSSNASSMEANITGSNANDTGMGAPHASNMTAEKVLAPNGTAPS